MNPIARRNLRPASQIKGIDDLLDLARAGSKTFPTNKLVVHADIFFNLKGCQFYPLQVSEAVKWQLLHAAKSCDQQIYNEFYVAHLSHADLVILFRIINSYALCGSSDNEATACKELMFFIKKHIFSLQETAAHSILEIFVLLIAQKDSLLDSLILDLQLIYQKNMLPHGSLITLAQDFYNLNGDPTKSLCISDQLKWQLLQAAKTSLKDGTVLFSPEFHPCNLPAHDLCTLYRIIYSHKECNLQAKFWNAVTIDAQLLAAIEDYIMSLCIEDPAAATALADELSKQTDSRFYYLITHVHEIIKLSKLMCVNALDKKQGVLSFVKNFYSAIDHCSSLYELENRFYYTLKIIDHLFPEKNVFNYFFDFKLAAQVAPAPDLAGLHLLVEHFNHKQKDYEKYYGKINNLILTTMRDLKTKLNEVVGCGFMGVKKFLVLHKGSVGGHYTSLYLDKNCFSSTLIISDSGGILSPTGEKSCFIDAIQKTIACSQLLNVKLVAFATRRQTDVLSCSIASLRDVLESYKCDLFNYVNTLPSEQKYEADGIMVVENYPPQFMKITQSVNSLAVYEEKLPNSKHTVVAIKTIIKNGLVMQEKKTLEQVVRKYTLSHAGQEINFYLRKRAFKYFTIILTSLFN